MEKLPDKAQTPLPSATTDFDVEFRFDLDEASWLAQVRKVSATPVLGTIGPFELLAEAGRGGQGVVYKARQPRTGRIIAIKRLSAGAFATPQMRARFERETEVAAALDHPGIVTVFGSEVVDGQTVLAMQWVDGEAIDRWAGGTNGDRRSHREILELFEKVCAAVHHAHQRGVIHRDIKPSNILVDADDEPHVLDFGLARLLSPFGPDSVFQTHTTGFVGTPAYASPEQLGARDATVDVRTDVFSLGCTLYQALTGRLPHEGRGSFASMMQAIEQYDPPRPSAIRPELDRELDTILLKSLAKAKEERYQSVAALAEDIRRFLNNEPVLAHPPSTWYQARKLTRRHRTAFTLSVALLGLIIAFAVTATLLAVREHRSRLEAQTAREAEKSQREEAEWNAYAASLAAADAALQSEDFARAQEHLKRSPHRLRNWEWRHLAHQADGSESTTPLAFPTVAIGADGGVVAAYDGSQLVRFQKVPEPAAGVFSRNRYGGRAITENFSYYSTISQGSTSVYEASGRTMARLDHPGSGCFHPWISPDGGTLVGADDFGHLLVYPLEGMLGNEDRFQVQTQPFALAVERFRLHENQADSLTLSADGRLVATGAGDGRIQVFKLVERRVIQTISTGERSISALAFSPAGNHLAAGSWDKQVKVWDLDAQQPVWTGEKHRDLVSALAYSSDGKLLASGSMDRTIRLWNAATGDCVGQLPGHDAIITGITFLPGGERLASYDVAGVLKTWQWQPDGVPTARGEFNRIVELVIASISDTAWLAVLEGPDATWRNPRLSIVDVRRRTKVGVLYVAEGTNVLLSALAVSADAKWLALGTTDGYVLLWAGDELARWLNEPDMPAPPPARVLPSTDVTCQVVSSQPGFDLGAPWGRAPSCWVVSVSIHPDNRRLAVTRYDGTVEIRDLESGETQYRIPQTADSKTRCCVFSPSGETFAVIEGHSAIRMHRTTDGALLVQRQLDGSRLSPASRFSPDGRLLVPLKFGSEICLLNASDLSEVRRFRGHTQMVNSVAFTADGSRLVSAGADATIRVWDVETGREVFSLRGHQFSANGLAFTQEGRTLISGGSDNAIRFWDAAR